MPRRLLASVVAAEVLVLTGCGSAPVPEQRVAGVERQSVALEDYPDAAAALRESSYRIGAAMLAAGRDAGPESNRVTSPVSALTALAMLRVGARTTTAEELDSVLAFPARHRDEAMNALLARWALHDGDPGSVDEEEPPEEPVLHLANGLFVAADLATGEAFLEPLARHYGAGVYPVDFGDGAALDAMNAWVNQHSGGRIEEVPIEPNERTRLNILSALFFAAAWEEPFDANSTAPGTFTTAAGTVETPMMNAMLPLAYAEGEGWQGIDLPYNNGFVMRLILPAGGVDPVLDARELNEVNDAMATAPVATVALSLPPWDHTSTLDLKEILITMGLEEAMGRAPDYSGISAEELYVEGAAQSANITVTEKGTIGAAVTQITMEETGLAEPDIELAFDRPFLYQVLHEETGLPVFLGTVMDPTQTS